MLGFAHFKITGSKICFDSWGDVIRNNTKSLRFYKFLILWKCLCDELRGFQQ